MDTNSLVIVTGLLALLAAYGAIQESGAVSAPASMRWRFQQSWTTSAAAIAALASIAFLGGEDESIIVVFGLVLLLGPLVYRGFSGSASSSVSLLMIVGAVMGWASLAILGRLASGIFSATRFELSVVPRMVINTFVILALLAALMSIYKGLRDAATGEGLDEDGSWVLP